MRVSVLECGPGVLFAQMKEEPDVVDTQMA